MNLSNQATESLNCRVARCPALNRTVRYYGYLSVEKIEVIPDMPLSGIFKFLGLIYSFRSPKQVNIPLSKLNINCKNMSSCFSQRLFLGKLRLVKSFVCILCA